MRGSKATIAVLFVSLSLSTLDGSLVRAGDTDARKAAQPSYYRPKLKVSPTLEPFLRHVTPGNDAFPEEKEAEELAVRLDELSRLLRESPARARAAAELLLAPEFKGGRLALDGGVSVGGSPLFEVVRSAASDDPKTPAAPPPAERGPFGEELGTLVAPFDTIQTAEFLITAIEVDRDHGPSARTQVRYDIVGSGKQAWRAQRVGRWRMEWLKGGDGAWRVVEWTALEDLRSRATAPVFNEVTDATVGRSASFRRQLAWNLDAWLATMDSSFMLDSMGHHGVSVGDADGDGLDDFYLAQPAGLPNLLFRNKGDGAFEDVTQAAGLAVLDETAHSLFADVDNDGDQDLILVTSGGLLLFLNDGKAHFTLSRDAFRFKALKGSPMSIAMADYDRDGFLDVYLCVYSYFLGAGEDKAGTPIPYYDAQNGPPSVLLRNDGRGHFMDVTEEVGLNENNDRYHFAAAWADYDDDGWPDLLVANDFGRKNLYHNEGMKDGKVRFKDVAAAAGVEDYGAGMSAAWLDYDNDGRLDIYTGNMWSANGQRITAEPGFMPDVPAEIRALYKRHARGNSLFRNKGEGTFEDVTLAARAEFGRWAWSSDALDFDNDGWEDLYVVNGMFTRDTSVGEADLDGYFWRQVAARSPLTRVTGSSYDDAWRAVNRLLATHSQANHQRNVFLRNDGKGRFDDVSGSVGLDLDQDGRSFAVTDYDLDGDADLVVMAPRSAPQLRLFRNDFPEKNASLAVRLVGTKSNRDAVGARVVVETDALRRTKVAMAGSGFISQHSQELLFGLGKSRRIVKVEVRWPSGLTQTFADLPLNHRVRIEEGGEPKAEAFVGAPPRAATAAAAEPAVPPSASWLYEPHAAPDFSMRDLAGQKRSVSALRGKPALLLLWASTAAPCKAALQELAAHHGVIEKAGASILTVALDGAQNEAKVRAAAQGLVGVPTALGNEEIGGTYTILNRHLFVGKDDLRLPTAFLLDAQGQIVKVYRDRIASTQIAADLSKIDATPAERLARAMPFPGTLYAKPSDRNYLQYGLELVEQGYETSALFAFERAAKGDPSAFTLYSLGTLYMKSGQPAKAKAAFERTLEVQPDFAEASNGLGALVAPNGNVPAAILLFRSALETTHDYPDALNNLGYALLQTGREQEGHELIEKALQLQPDFPEAFNNLGIFFAGQGDMARGESYFKQAVEKRPGYGEAGNNLALVLMARDDVDDAVAVLQRLMEANPDFEMTYVTLSKIYLTTNRQRQGVQVLERLLQKNPKNPLALQIMRELRGGQ
jgi:Tfp pilus assembly protein PilF/peroxiredoxin